METGRFNLLDLIIKVLVFFIFVLILVWVIPQYTKNATKALNNQIFNNNVQSMKEAARNYFTVDKLPDTYGNKVKMTLEDMTDDHMVLPIVDQYGKECDLERSYVEAERLSDDKYELKVKLVCSKESNFIKDIIGCYDVCTGGNCGNNDGNDNNSGSSSTTVTEYEFKRSINKSSYYCESGYTLNGEYCYKSIIADKYAATKTSTEATTKTVDALINKGGTITQYAEKITNGVYICSSEYDNAGTYNKLTTCVKTTFEKEQATKKTVYTCSDDFANAGTYLTPVTCYKNASYTEPATQATTYTCSDYYDNKGTYNVATLCIKTTVTRASAPASTTNSFVCSDYYDNKGTYSIPTTCYKTIKDPAPPSSSTTYSCSSGTPSGSGSSMKCITTTSPQKTTVAGAQTCGWSCGSCNTQTFNTSKTSTSTTRYELVNTTSKYVCSLSSCPGTVVTYYYKVYTYGCSTGASTTEWRCPSGYSPSGVVSENTQCKKESAATPSTKTTYTCSSYYDNDNTYTSATTCIKTVVASATPSAKTVYTCSQSYDNPGTYDIPTTCEKSTTVTAQAPAQTSYTCSKSFNNAGTYTVPTICVKTSSDGYNPAVSEKYVCDTKFDNRGTYSNPTECYKKNETKVKAEDKSEHTCPEGFTKKGTDSNITCSKTTKTSDKYYCQNSNARLEGNKCIINVNGNTNYTCKKGYVLSGTTCLKYSNEKIAAKQDCTTGYEYKWSTEESIAGWEKTGNTRSKQVNNCNTGCETTTNCSSEKITCIPSTTTTPDDESCNEYNCK